MNGLWQRAEQRKKSTRFASVKSADFYQIDWHWICAVQLASSPSRPHQPLLVGWHYPAHIDTRGHLLREARNQAQQTCEWTIQIQNSGDHSFWCPDVLGLWVTWMDGWWLEVANHRLRTILWGWLQMKFNLLKPVHAVQYPLFLLI